MHNDTMHNAKSINIEENCFAITKDRYYVTLLSEAEFGECT